MMAWVFSWNNDDFKYETPEVEVFDSMMKLDTRLEEFLDDLYEGEVDEEEWADMTLDEKREYHDEMVGYSMSPNETDFWVVGVEVQ